MQLSRDLSTYIGLGGGKVIGITVDERHLVIQDENYTMDLGIATKYLFADMTEFVDRLSIHAVGGE